MRLGYRFTLVASLLIALQMLLPQAPAHADALPGNLSDNWNWSTSQPYEYCYNVADNPFVRDCDETSIGHVSFQISISLNGRQPVIKTSWSTPVDEKQLKVFSFIE